MDIVFPARDQSIARIVETISEADVGKPADNFVTNEDSFARVASDLARLAPSDGVTIGVGPDQNFTYIAHSKPRLSFLVDFRRRNALLHLIHKSLFTIARNRAEYLSMLTGRNLGALPGEPSAEELVAAVEGVAFDRNQLERTIDQVVDFLAPLKLVSDPEWPEIATIQSKLAGPGLGARFLALPMYPTLGRLIRSRDRQNQPAHFLAREDWFQVVRNSQIGDRVIPVVGDFAGHHALANLGEWLGRRGLAVSVIYVSDVEFFLLRSGRFASYIDNLAKLPWKPDALLIRTSTREIDHPERLSGDSSTTILRPVAKFLDDAKAGRIKSIDDLFL